MALDRKPENGLEIQNIACGRLRIMLGLKLVKSAVETARISSQSHEALDHRTKILVDLCTPWNDKERIVCADSYYASVEASETLLENLRFTGVIKSCTKRFPMRYFNNQQLFEKGSYKKLISLRLSSGEQKDIAAVCWLDRTRRHFLSTVGSTSRTVLQERVRWRQFTDGACRMVVQVEMPHSILRCL